MRLLLLAFALVLLAGCDGLGSDDPFESDYLSVYAFTARDGGGVVTSGRVGLELVPSDVSGVPSLLRGLWDLDAQGEPSVEDGRLDGLGSLRGDAGESVVLAAFFDVPEPGLGPPTEPAPYRLRGTFSDGGARFAGTWEVRDEAGAVVASGPFEADLTREATQFYVAG